MITIYNANGKKLKSIPSHHEFFDRVSVDELLEDHLEHDPKYDPKNWNFVVYPHAGSSYGIRGIP